MVLPYLKLSANNPNCVTTIAFHGNLKMRTDKLTTKFQQALSDAQSMALGNDGGYIEPQHLLLALINQEDGGTTSLLARAGIAVPRLKAALEKAIKHLPKVEGQGGEISASRDLGNLLNLTDKEATKRGDEFKIGRASCRERVYLAV